MSGTEHSLHDLSCTVLGAGGFIGTNLCCRLAGKVSRLRAFDLVHPDAPAVEEMDWVTGDFSHPQAIRKAVSGADIVYHLIGTTTPATSNRDMTADFQGNVINSIRFLDVCRLEGVKRVIFISSGGTVYGIPALIPTPESAPTRPITSYGISKLAVEMYLELYRHHHGLDYRVLRLANPYGPYQTTRNEQGVVPAFLHRAVSGLPVEVWGDGSVARDFVFIDDVVEALMIAALHSGPVRTFNIGSGEALSVSSLISAIQHLLGRKVEIKYLAARPVDVPISVLDTSLAARELGWTPTTSLYDGLKITLDWLVRAGDPEDVRRQESGNS